MAQGNYDHPSYTARQMDNLGVTTAGANGTSVMAAYPMDMRIRRISALVVTAGTTAGAFLYPMAFNGTVTTTMGTVTLTTNTANSVIQLADVNTLLPTGALLGFKNGTDATGKAIVTVELHGDPLTGTWSPP